MTRKKIRPQPGDRINASMSERDMAATGIATRKQIQTWKKLASIPESELKRIAEEGF